MTALSKNVHMEKLPKLVDKYNNIIYSLIELKPADVKPDA